MEAEQEDAEMMQPEEGAAILQLPANSSQTDAAWRLTAAPFLSTFQPPKISTQRRVAVLSSSWDENTAGTVLQWFCVFAGCPHPC